MKRFYRFIFVMALALGSVSAALSAEAPEAVEVAESCRAAGVSGGIQLSATESAQFEVYSITGQKLKSVTVDGAAVKVELPKGCYIVRCSQWSKKVVVK